MTESKVKVKTRAKKKETNPVGRPLIVTKEIVNKLEWAFSVGATDEEACIHAEISKQTLYNYIERNPEFLDRKEGLKKKPILKAKSSLFKGLDDPNLALKYLERKCKDEFSLKTENTNTNLEVDKDMVNDRISKMSDDDILRIAGVK